MPNAPNFSNATWVAMEMLRLVVTWLEYGEDWYPDGKPEVRLERVMPGEPLHLQQIRVPFPWKEYKRKALSKVEDEGALGSKISELYHWPTLQHIVKEIKAKLEVPTTPPCNSIVIYLRDYSEWPCEPLLDNHAFVYGRAEENWQKQKTAYPENAGFVSVILATPDQTAGAFTFVDGRSEERKRTHFADGRPVTF